MSNKRGGANKVGSWEFFYIYLLHTKQYLWQGGRVAGWQVSQKSINVEVLIKHVVGKILSKRISKTP